MKITDNSLALEKERSSHSGITTLNCEVNSSKYYNLGFYRTADLFKSITGLLTVHLLRSTTSATAAKSTR
jgi:hypothetical protein